MAARPRLVPQRLLQVAEDVPQVPLVGRRQRAPQERRDVGIEVLGARRARENRVDRVVLADESIGGVNNRCHIAAHQPAQRIVRRHPGTGRPALYIGRHASHIAGEDEAESRALLERLCENACRPPRIFTHRWRVGDLVLWDNRCVLHRGLGHPPDQARHMTRTTLAGDGASNEWSLTA